MSMDALCPTPTPLALRREAFVEKRRHFDGQLDEQTRRWWHQALEQLADQPSANTLVLLSSQCKRRLGDAPLAGQPDCKQTQQARALLVAQLLEQQAGGDQLALLRQLFLWGDDQEKSALLSILDDLDSQGRSLDLALQAGRTNNREVFAAIALDNPFPARHYPERAFHQLVLKSLGMGLDSGRILGLAQRRSVDLNQLALEHMEEQLAAGRSVSDALPQVIAFELLSQAQRQRLRGLCQQQRLPAHWLRHLPPEA
ncbi:EboA domain-containing protein [Pseudomonas sp. NFXW11]|uniref:EboA domain-containing protein n=1 Tax=Pseudomonas sp. NFXW11 TaxID=2819531 RepID=UPI003CE86B89